MSTNQLPVLLTECYTASQNLTEGLYKDHWEFSVHKKTTTILICPIVSVMLAILMLRIRGLFGESFLTCW